MNRKGFGILEVFLVALAMTAIAYLFEASRGSDQNIQVAKADNVATDNTGKRPAQFKVWIEKKEGEK